MRDVTGGVILIVYNTGNGVWNRIVCIKRWTRGEILFVVYMKGKNGEDLVDVVVCGEGGYTGIGEF